MRATAVRSISALKTRTQEVVDQVVGSEPVLITQNGRARVVLIDARQYQEAQATLAMLTLLAQSQDSLIRVGRTYSGAEIRRRACAVLGSAGKR